MGAIGEFSQVLLSRLFEQGPAAGPDVGSALAPSGFELPPTNLWRRNVVTTAFPGNGPGGSFSLDHFYLRPTNVHTVFLIHDNDGD